MRGEVLALWLQGGVLFCSVKYVYSGCKVRWHLVWVLGDVVKLLWHDV